jgi:hypothetical protein
MRKSGREDLNPSANFPFRSIPVQHAVIGARFGRSDEWHVDVGKSQSKNEMCKKASLA